MELLQVADAVAREKGIEKEIVIVAMEEAIQKAGRAKYGHDHDIRAFINRKDGSIKLKRYREVLENGAEIENDIAQMPLDDARRIKPDAEVGEFLIDELPPLDFGRIAAQTAKQVIMQKVREAERARQYEEFKDKKFESPEEIHMAKLKMSYVKEHIIKLTFDIKRQVEIIEESFLMPH